MAEITGNRYRTQGGSTELPPATCSQAKQNAAAGRLVSSVNKSGIVLLTASMHTLPDASLAKHSRASGKLSSASEFIIAKTDDRPLPEKPLKTLPWKLYR